MTSQNPLRQLPSEKQIQEYKKRRKWQEDASKGLFDIEPYLKGFSSNLPEFEDVFVTDLNIEPRLHLPALPSMYATEYHEERVMYLLGAPRSMTRERLKEIISNLGVVVKLPMVIDLKSRETFRWVVMKDAEEATRVFKLLPLLPVAELVGSCIVALTPCVPGRGLILEYHVNNKTFPPQSKTESMLVHAQKYDLDGSYQAFLSDKNSDPGRLDSNIRKSSEWNAQAPTCSMPPPLVLTDRQPNPLRAASDHIASQLNDDDGNDLHKALNSDSQHQGYLPHQYLTPAAWNNPFTSLERYKQVEPTRSNPLLEREQVHNRSLVDLLRRAGLRNEDRLAGEINISPPALKAIRRPTLSKVTALPRLTRINTQGSSCQAAVPSSSSQTDIETLVEQEKTNDKHLTTPTEGGAGTAAPRPAPPASSWASIAKAGDTKVIDIASFSTTNQVNRLRAINRVRSGTGPPITEPEHEQLRLVFILNVPQTLKFQDLENAIKEGPLRSMHFGMDETNESRYAGVVFHKAADAEEFVRILQLEKLRSRPGRFNWCPEVVRSEFAMDNILSKMNAPMYATRRLTLVKGGLFFQFHSNQLTAMIEKEIGEGHIMTLFYYNGGNATVVFTEVGYAIKAKEKLDRYASTAGVPGGAPLAWDGLQVTFSKDPCAAPLVLISAMH